MTTTPRLAMSYIVSSQAQKEVTHNEALNDLDFLTQPSVLSTTLAAPPASPSTGDAYIVAASATDAWEGYDGCLAAYYGGWVFKTPQTGWVVWAQNLSQVLYYTGAAWALLSTPKLNGSCTWTPGTVADGAGVLSSTITVSGAAFGDFVLVSAPYDLQGVVASAYVSAADTVSISLSNTTGASVTFASGAWSVRVIKA
ncbi:MAG: DUF2793 domain-containing protein [Alphaproteobacteria bacterium]|nr:DUF2793 domain-containing protein [Alphaproteobacteria bacterium]